MLIDWRTLSDLGVFVRLEIGAGDIEPWAAVIGELFLGGDLTDEETLWLVKLYNATDDLGSAWRIFTDFSSPQAWQQGGDARHVVKHLSLSQERRGLRGGRIVAHLDSYVDRLAGQTQLAWLYQAVRYLSPSDNFTAMMRQMRDVWGVGRQTSFEWAEFVAKILHAPIEPADAVLWESTGPRESIERLYNEGRHNTSVNALNSWASHCRQYLVNAGLPLSWWDFETVICDFNVMRKGRYYPGQHLAMIREEIEGLSGPGRSMLLAAFNRAIPEDWREIAPGVDTTLRRAYRDSGAIVTPLDRSVDAGT